MLKTSWTCGCSDVQVSSGTLQGFCTNPVPHGSWEDVKTWEAQGKGPTSGYRPSSHQPNWSSYYKGGGTANTTAWDGRQSMFEGSTDGEMRPRMRGMKHASPEPLTRGVRNDR